MEQVHGTNKASKFASQNEDVINRMPENVITHILDRLPIRDAVGTSILSRNWRFNWTMLTRLIFDEEFFDSLPTEEDYDWRIIISRLLIHIKGPVTKFVFCILDDDRELKVEDINHWIMFLSRKGIQDLTLSNCPVTELMLPSHLFSCLELKHLELEHCFLRPPPTFYGFPNLLSLYIGEVTNIDNCMEMITKCPLLEILTIIDNISTGKMKLVEISKLKNLKVFSLPLSILDNVTNTTSAIFQLGCDLPKLQDLSLHFRDCKFIEDTDVRKWGCTAFLCLKKLHLYQMDLSSSMMISCAFEIIRGSPNLQTLMIIAPYNGVGVPTPEFSFPEVDNTKLQLRSVEFIDSRGSENEVYLIKYVLACSPLLHNMTIHARSSQVVGGYNGMLMFATKLLEFHRASPIAEVKLNRF